ncbi:MAG: SRPBCC family protein [Acidimicrobiia bacterium]|nr:SRPBCC family protein [Acidimicrobiia bacterium]
MKITQEFEVSKPLQPVWDAFQDIASVAQCLPGADLTEDHGDGTYSGKVEAKLGPMTALFEGQAKVEADPASHSGHIDGKGADKRGGSRGQVKVDYRLEQVDGGTKVIVDADVTLSGAAAQFGRTGLIKEMSSRLIAEFVECLEAKLSAATVEEAQAVVAADVKGVSLFLSSLLSTIAAFFKRLFGRN